MSSPAHNEKTPDQTGFDASDNERTDESDSLLQFETNNPSHEPVSGNKEKFDELFKSHEKKIFNVCLRFCGGDRHLAQDLVQETFISAYLKLSELRDSSCFSSWIYNIAKNKSITYLRKQNTYSNALSEYEVLKEILLEDHRTWTEPELQIIEDLIGKISNKSLKETVTYFYQEGKSIPEIAEIQDISITAITSRLSRFRSKFKRSITLAIIEKRASGQ